MICEVSITIASFFGLSCIESRQIFKIREIDSHALKATNRVVQDQGNKFTHIKSTIFTSIKVQIPSFISTMLTRQWEELNII
jgi:hypothetical protein